jgi:hypothetical protein
MNHKWKQWESRGVTSGSGRPHGVDVWRTCTRCGMVMGSGPQSTHTGARVVRRWHRPEDGHPVPGWAVPRCEGAAW